MTACSQFASAIQNQLLIPQHSHDRRNVDGNSLDKKIEKSAYQNSRAEILAHEALAHCAGPELLSSEWAERIITKKQFIPKAPASPTLTTSSSLGHPASAGGMPWF